jgi:hypothetical protein
MSWLTKAHRRHCTFVWSIIFSSSLTTFIEQAPKKSARLSLFQVTPQMCTLLFQFVRSCSWVTPGRFWSILLLLPKSELGKAFLLQVRRSIDSFHLFRSGTEFNVFYVFMTHCFCRKIDAVLEEPTT